jgi:predicted aldo/keto reductase-like oxidoreductase
MWTKPYGTTGKNISAVSFGGMRFGQPDDIDAMAEMVHYAHGKGINYFDTAPGYFNGQSEKIMGQAFKHMPRESFYASTKSMKADGDEMREQLETSLKHMNIDTVDFFHIWCIVTLDAWKDRLERGAVAAALKAKEEGLVNHVVVSSHLPGEQLSQVINEGPFEGVLLGYCAVNFPYRERTVQLAGERKLGVMTMNPLAGGAIPENPERFDFIRGEHDANVVEAAIRFNVSNPHVTSALVGFSTKEQVDQAVAAVENFHPYPAEHVDAIRAKVQDSFNDLCTGCGYCLPCPQDLDVPKLMDAHNVSTLSGGDMTAADGRLKYHWFSSAGDPAECSQCGLCESRCTQHLPIRERMGHLADGLPK